MKNKEEYNKMTKHRNEIVDVNERLHQTGYNNQGDSMEITLLCLFITDKH